MRRSPVRHRTSQSSRFGDSRLTRINYRWAPDASSVRTQAAELVAARPELIVATSTPALAAAQQATSTIPIVFNSVTDPVAQRFIAASGGQAATAPASVIGNPRWVGNGWKL